MSPTSAQLRDALKQAVKAIDNDQELIPGTLALLVDPDFDEFSIKVEKWGKRAYDGWFHPSTHATWTARQLYYYLVAPNHVEVETMTMTSVIAITQGHFLHDFFQHIWMGKGLLDEAEVPMEDPQHNRRGHADGRRGVEVVEIKSINDYQIDKIVNEAILKEKKPGYWYQAQEYLDMLGMEVMRYFMVTTSYPYKMQEFLVRFDPEHARVQRRKYRSAINARDRGVLPPACCTPGSNEAKACPVRRACPIGRQS